MIEVVLNSITMAGICKEAGGSYTTAGETETEGNTVESVGCGDGGYMKGNKVKCSDLKDKFSRVEKPILGRMYHLSWAYAGARWNLRALYDDGYCRLETPVTGKMLLGHVDDLRELRKRTPPLVNKPSNPLVNVL